MQDKTRTLNFENQAIYIGLDTHLKSCVTTILTEHLEHKTFVIDPKAEVLAKYLHKHFPGGDYYSAYEASFAGFRFHRELLKLGIKNIVVNPADIPTTNKERVQKEDKRDSRKIAKLLRANALESIYIPSEEMQEIRMLIRHRRTLAKEIGKNKNRVKSMLYFLGIELSVELNSGSRYWSKRYTEWLRNLELVTVEGRLALNSIIDTTEQMRSEQLKINRQIRELFKTGKHAKILNCLLSVPGIGPVTAATILVEIEDINRFKREDQLCSFIGIIPSTHSSGEQEVTGGITSRSNKNLRSLIIEASWIAARRDPALNLCFNKYCKELNKNQAIIRIAKKLVKRIRYVMKHETEYVTSI